MAKTLLLIFLGQLVSFDLAIVSFTVSLITNQSVDAPLSVSFFSYSAMALVLGSLMLYTRRKLLVAWYWYVLLGFVDVQGNYLVTKAYEYTSITSVVILDCCTIAWAIVLTRLFLGTRNFVSRRVMSMVGVFGMLVSASGMATYERKSLETITWSPQLVYAYVGCTMASFMFDTLGPLVLKMSGATLFNLSLLTSDMWVVVIRIFIYKQQVKWLYYPAYALVIVGIFVYLTTGKDESIDDIVDDENPHLEYHILKEENVDVEDCTPQ